MERKNKINDQGKRKKFTEFATKIFLVVSLFVSLSDAHGKTFRKGEIILIRSPQKLSVQNKYKQRLDENQKKEMLQFEPFYVLGKDETSPLQKTLKCKTRFGIYYLVLDENGNLANSEDNEIKILKNYAWEYTGKIKANYRGEINFFSFKLNNNVVKMLDNNSKIEIIAGKNGKYLINLDDEIGLAKLPKKFFKENKNNTENNKLTNRLLAEIEKYFEQVNKKITKAYYSLNSKSKKQNEAPVFEKISPFHYKFTNARLNDFPNIAKYLLDKINLQLLNKNYEAKIQNNSIVITKIEVEK